MAPKKKNPSRGAGGGSYSKQAAAELKLSAENEAKLRRLLLQKGAAPTRQQQQQGILSEQQRKRASRRLRLIYDDLASEGFSTEHIHQALAAIPVEAATLEACLDWLCLNLAADELPRKFSSGKPAPASEGGGVQVLSAASTQWTGCSTSAEKDAPELVPSMPLRTSQQQKQPIANIEAEQADWIRQYVAQQEEEEENDNSKNQLAGDDTSWELWSDPLARRWRQAESKVGGAPRAINIPAEFQAAKQAAAEAKRLGNKDKQEAASRVIWELKQELFSLGLSEDLLDSNGKKNKQDMPCSQREVAEKASLCNVKPTEDGSKDHEHTVGKPLAKGALDSRVQGLENEIGTGLPGDDSEPGRGILTIKEEVGNSFPGLDDEGMADMFDETSMSDQALPDSIINMQLNDKAKSSFTGTIGKSVSSNQRKIKFKGKAEETLKEPKVVLQQHCQRNGWAAPKYDRLSGTKDSWYLYSVTVNRPPTGRGKSKVPGGPISIRLLTEPGGYKTSAEAQNAVAAWALFTLFPELPLYRTLPTAYQDLYKQWLAQGEKATIEAAEAEDVSRTSFIDAVLSARAAGSQRVEDRPDLELPVPEGDGHTNWQSNVKDKHRSKLNKEANSRHLLQLFQEKQLNEEYKGMLERRNALPMAVARDELLAKLQEWDAIVVSGETGSGKTTQVPQYILDDMIKAGAGGFCNIVCTQPRRIAAISVAERVAVERCEASPGSYGSLVGYQVRLDAARNQGTRLLFCTTGILLRRFASDPDLTEVSHVVVDEVHERTILGDFLLIMLRDLIKTRRQSGQPLKLIVMSATLDAALFSKYLGGCPIISVEGRTHPVKTYFLEDIYEWLDYKLPSDSPAAIHQTYQRKAIKNLVGSSRGRQNLAQLGLGDECVLEEGVANPLYDEDLYQGLTSTTRDNLVSLFGNLGTLRALPLKGLQPPEVGSALDSHLGEGDVAAGIPFDGCIYTNAKLNEEVIDYDLVEDIIIAIDEQLEPGAMLVFLPGQAEIQQVLDRLRVSKRFSSSSAEWVLPLHSAIASADQRKVFASPQDGSRKVVLATNIAEASITIDDVVYVLDCGKHKENRFDSRRGMASLVEAWISQANAKQRSGRAGRVQPGKCFCLYTSHRFNNILRPYQVPEMLRVPLVELCLQIKVLSLGDVTSFLQKALEPPTTNAVQSAISTLHQVGAVDEHEAITSLGYHLAALPVDVHIGKMMLYGAIFGCLSPVATVGACLSHKTPFLIPQEEREAAGRKIQSLLNEAGQDTCEQNNRNCQQSDHLAMIAAYNRWSRIGGQRGGKAARAFCSANYLSLPTLNMLRDIRNQLVALVEEIGFVTFGKTQGGRRNEQWLDDMSQPFNKHSCHTSVVKATICAGLYPNVAAMDEDSIKQGHASALSLRAGLSSGRKPRWFDGHREVFIHPSSVNSGVSEFHHPFLVFHEKVNTSKVYLRDTTVVSPYTLLLFGGSIGVEHKAGRVTVDEWLHMHAPAQTAVYFKELRLALDSLMKSKIGAPRATVSFTEDGIIPIITQLLIDEDKPSGI